MKTQVQYTGYLDQEMAERYSNNWVVQPCNYTV